MVEGLLPPFVEPSGPLRDDAEVIRAFVRREPAGYSADFHVEWPVLLAQRDVPIGLRLGPGVVLVRTDPPDEMAVLRLTVERALAERGLRLLDRDVSLAVPVALQLVGLRLSRWDLWGTDRDEAHAAVRTSAAGDDIQPVAEGPFA
ncbi:MAG: hypothetical protein ACRD0U_01045 [Acidimicrobiales bacterium]